MTSSLYLSRVRRKSAGVAIVTAIFLLVALAGLAVAIVTLTTTQQSASALDVQGQRAYQAARAGVEWALYIGLATGDQIPFGAAGRLGCDAQSASKSFPMPVGTTLSAFTVTVTCGPRIPGVAGSNPNDANDPTGGHFVIISRACNQPVNGACPNPSPGPDYVQREIRAQL
jgi:MSHA biogenesis protein MshP